MLRNTLQIDYAVIRITKLQKYAKVAPFFLLLSPLLICSCLQRVIQKARHGMTENRSPGVSPDTTPIMVVMKQLNGYSWVQDFIALTVGINMSWLYMKTEENQV